MSGGRGEHVAIVVEDPDPGWPLRFAEEQRRIEAALGPRALAVEHVGSTAVEHLPAKPIIDVCLVVADSSDEASYAPLLERAGYELHIREPEWHEHRMFRTPGRDVHLHVFTVGSPEVARMLVFRDWLRSNPADRELYASTKRELARHDWPTMQHYADAKTEVVEAIMTRALRP